MSVSSNFEPIRPVTKGAEAPGAIGRAQLGRLFRLVVILQSERFPNARELSERCEVSRRTTYRDLELLEAAGVPVSYRPERQGYQLAKGFFLRPPEISEAEALALLVLSRQWKGGDGLGLVRDAREAALKVIQGLPVDVRDRVLSASEPFLPGASPTAHALGRRQVFEVILDSLVRQRQLRLWYRDPVSLETECTKFAVYKVVLHDRQWYLVGRSSLVRRVEMIGVSWVDRAMPTDDPFTVPPRFNLERFLAGAWGVERNPRRHAVWLRFSARAAPRVRDTEWHESQRPEFLPDGRIDMHFEVAGLDEILRWVVSFGDEVTVLAPTELRDGLLELAGRIARLYEPST